MLIFDKIKSLTEHITKLGFENSSISVGFVPTMGALHAGHLSLIERAKHQNDIVISSIFVNPIQFNDKSDLKNYPRNIETDIEKLRQYDCDIVFIPDEKEMFHDHENIVFDLNGLDLILEGKYREGHFQGVAYIVLKFFNILKPTRAYFGLKDYQQVLVIKKMVEKLKITTEIVECPTIREKDGLALSSRNLFLTSSERLIAPEIYKTLAEAKSLTKSLSVYELKNWVEKKINSNSLFKLEYFEIVDADSLEPILNWNESRRVIACIAVFLGKIRLIDNIILF